MVLGGGEMALLGFKLTEHRELPLIALVGAISPLFLPVLIVIFIISLLVSQIVLHLFLYLLQLHQPLFILYHLSHKLGDFSLDQLLVLLVLLVFTLVIIVHLFQTLLQCF